MTVPAARLAAQPSFVSAVISDDHDDLIYAVAHFVIANEFSPPLTILRI